MTGVGQTTGEICLQYAEDLGWDLMEISAHAGARPSHAAWQGQIVSLSGKPGYLSKEDIGYGTGAGFKGWNCRHDWYPYLEGSKRMYSSQELAALEEKNIEFPDGSMHTLYETEQYQRALERKIRESKRILAAENEWMKNSISEEANAVFQKEFDKQAVILKQQEANLTSFCSKTGLSKDSSRVRQMGFNQSVAQKAVQREKASIRIEAENVQYMQYLHDLRTHRAELKGRQAEILKLVPDRDGVATLRKKQVRVKDLAALTAHTGDEFALFTKGRRAIIYHGSPNGCTITGKTSDQIITERWEWVAHSHPTTTQLYPSREDINALKRFTWQKDSSIIDLNGSTITFTADEQDFFNSLLGVTR